MSATVTVSVRIPLKQVSIIRRAAKAAGIKLTTFVRNGAYEYALATLQTPTPYVDRMAMAQRVKAERPDA